MITPYIVPPRQPEFEHPLGPVALHRISPVQALQNFFPHASQAWMESVEEEVRVAVPEDGESRAGDIMQAGVITVSVDTTLRDLVQMLTQKRISGVPVVDSQGNPTGVISLTDVATFVGQNWLKSRTCPQAPMVWEDALGESLGETQVAEVMSPFVYFVEKSASLSELAEIMLGHHIHRVLVLEEKEIVGIVSSLDLIKAYHQVPPAGINRVHG